jgi:hypothetical protein
VTSHQTPFLQHQPEELAFADEGLGRSIGDDDSMKDSDDEVEEPHTSDIDSDYNPSQKRKHSFTSRAGRTSPRRTRSLQSTSQSTTTSPTLSSHNRRRITKPTHANRRRTTSSPKLGSGNPSNKRLSSKTTKQFPCTFSHYGCSAIFASKNEWKRHVASQHLQLGFYRCDAGFCVPDSGAAGNGKTHHTGGGRGHNDFNRKDLFTQHWRRMHLPASFGAGKYENAAPARKEEFDRDMEEVRARCWVVRREGPRRAQCGVCGKAFEGIGAWEERMEHLGRHFERGERGEGDGVKEDEWLTEWAVGEAVVTDLGARGKWLVGMKPDEEEEKVEDGVAVAVGDARVGRRERRTAVAVAVEDEDDSDDD